MTTTMAAERAWGRVTLVAALGLAGAAGPLAAQQRIDEVRPLRADATVEVKVVTHLVNVETWNRNEIQVRGSYDPEREELTIRGGEGSLTFEIRHPRNIRGHWEGPGDRTLEVRVPAGVRLEVGSVSGDVRASGLRGTASLSTVSGSARVEAQDMESLRINSVSGDAVFNGRVGELRAAAVSGAVRLNGDASSVRASSVSGDVEVSGVREASSVELNSVSGSVRFTGGLARTGELSAESHSGSVTLTLPPGVDARFRLATFSGSITVDLPGVRDEVRERGRYTPDESLSFVTGSGAGRVRAESFAGRIRIQTGGG